jgi:hypothetical protein
LAGIHYLLDQSFRTAETISWNSSNHRTHAVTTKGDNKEGSSTEAEQ